MKKLLLPVVFLFAATAAQAELYRTTTIRAAPGKLLELIEYLKAEQAVHRRAGEEIPFWMRHSQGDQWDILLLAPIGSFEDYYSPSRIRKRESALRAARRDTEESRQAFSRLLAWHEDLFVEGPPLAEVRRAFEGAGFFHVEMFIALPGKHAELRQQRAMENVYLKELGRPQNLIFNHVEGAAWTAFTIGCYRDLKHFAESADIPEEREDRAARKAGFESASHIGPYLRTLISEHHDTLAVAIR